MQARWRDAALHAECRIERGVHRWCIAERIGLGARTVQQTEELGLVPLVGHGQRAVVRGRGTHGLRECA